MRKLALGLLSIGLLCSDVLADQITMKNGDRLTGTIVKFDGEKLTMKSEFAGEVQILWAAIEKATSDNAVYVTSKDGRVLIGTLTSTNARENSPSFRLPRTLIVCSSTETFPAVSTAVNRSV